MYILSITDYNCMINAVVKKRDQFDIWWGTQSGNICYEYLRKLRFVK